MARQYKIKLQFGAGNVEVVVDMDNNIIDEKIKIPVLTFERRKHIESLLERVREFLTDPGIEMIKAVKLTNGKEVKEK